MNNGYGFKTVLVGRSFSLLKVCNMVARFVKSERTGRRHCVKSPLILRVEVVCDGKAVYAMCYFSPGHVCQNCTRRELALVCFIFSLYAA